MRSLFVSTITIVLILIVVASRPAAAGPNQGGTLVVHTDSRAVYSQGDAPYCGAVTLETGDSLTTNIPGGVDAVWWVFAPFSRRSNPRVAEVTFGIDYDESAVTLLESGPCGDFEIPTASWPSPGEGTTVVWNAAQTADVTEVYWFAGYAAYGIDTTFDLTAHPTEGATFIDDSIPPEIDSIDDLGSLGFNAAAGDPTWQLFGCCVLEVDPFFCDSEMTLAECQDTLGIWITTSLENPEDPPGACCLLGEIPCWVLGESDCYRNNGDFLGENTSCQPDPCSTSGTGQPDPIPSRLELSIAGSPTAGGNPVNVFFELPATGTAELKVFDVRGQLVRTIVDGVLNAGRHSVTWDGRDGNGRPAFGGVYFVRLASGSERLTERVVVVR